ncbi:MAG: TIM barrel protein [Actinomycetota bacterium]
MSGLLERVAGAPISWGVCEAPGWGHQLDPARVLREMNEIGLRATELGPDGYLPTDPKRLQSLLASYDMRLVGGFVPVVLHWADGLADELAQAARSADLLAALGCKVLVLSAATGESGYEGTMELDANEWKRLVRAIDRVIELGAERGLSVALHPHFGTIIESPQQIERLLESSTVPLCIDTGHLLVGGSDPLEISRAARDRIEHVHLKDVAADLAEQIRERRIGYHEAVGRGLYKPLGRGDIALEGIVGALEGHGYRGWYVLEQDAVLETDPEEGRGPIRDARASLEFLTRAARGIEAGISAG